MAGFALCEAEASRKGNVMKRARTDLVIFDCDGVLIDSEIISARVLITELARVGIVLDLDHVRRHFLGRSFPTVAEDIRRNFECPLPGDFEARYRKGLIAEFQRSLRLTEGLLPVLDRLCVPACVATSSSPPRVAQALRIVRLADRFGADVFTASEVPRGKPAPDLFLHAASRMGVAPKRCLVIEDSVPGVAAALAASMPVLRYTGGAHLKGEGFLAGQSAASGVVSFDSWAEFAQIRPDLMNGTIHDEWSCRGGAEPT